MQVRYATPRLLVEAGKEPNNQSMEEDKAGLSWISAVELLQAGYERDDLELVLRLFETGTRPGALVLRSSELETERAAWHMAAVNVTHKYFDFCNLHEVAQGTLQKLHCAAVSNIQSSFLAAFVSIHGAGPVEVCLPAPVLPVVLGFHRDGSSSGRPSDSEAEWPPAHTAADPAHFEKLKREGGVDQVWLIKKHTGERFVQHNLADGTYKAYIFNTSQQVDSGAWKMVDGAYSEKDETPAWGGILRGDAAAFKMEVERPPHGMHYYTPTLERYNMGSVGDTALDDSLLGLPYTSTGQLFLVTPGHRNLQPQCSACRA